MPDPRGTWRGMESYLKGLAASLPEKPRAILVVSGHWEAPAFAFTGASSKVRPNEPCSSGGFAYGVLISTGGLRAVKLRVAFSTLRGLDAVVVATVACGAGELSFFFST